VLTPAPSASAQRIRLRPERPWQEHLDLYRQLFGDPAVLAALSPGSRPGPLTDRRAAELLEADIRHWHRESFGPWLFFEASSGLFVGRGGLCRCTVLGSQRVEVLYAVRPELWGNGYATEMAAVSLARAPALGLEEVVGFTAVSNGASRRVLEKAGLRFERTFERAGLPHWLGGTRIRPRPGPGPRR